MIRRILIWGIITALPAITHAQSASPADDVADNSGQDPTRPVTRVDLREKYDDNPAGAQALIITLRADKPFLLGDGWKLSTRADLPILDSTTATPANPTGRGEWGIGDALFQALVVAPPMGRAAVAFGGQLIAPTGADTQFTTGKWQAVPTAAAIYQMPEISRGTFIGLLVRDAFSFAGKKNRASINVVSLEPLFNWQLPKSWFLTFAPEMKMDTKNDWRLFVPFDVTIGRKLGPRTVMSLQLDAPLIRDYPQYDWQAEFRIGFFF